MEIWRVLPISGVGEIHITKEHILGGCVVKGEVREKFNRIQIKMT